MGGGSYVFFLLILAGGIVLFRKIPLLTSDGAMIMALGILTNVFINQNSPLAREFGPGITLFALALLMSLFFLVICRQGVNGNF